MALIDFKNIPLYEIPTDGVPVLSSDIVGGGNGVVYDETWGYITVQQSMDFEYDQTGKYISKGTFNINGVFTINAEHGFMVEPSGSYGGNSYTDVDEANFEMLKAKYNSLVESFETASLASAPSDIDDYGTINDDRLVQLPAVLRNSSNSEIYARPLSINVTETRWSSIISYTAVLSEADIPTGKVVVDGSIIDKGVVTINARKPRLAFQDFAFANGQEIYFDGWETRTYSVAGTLPEVAPSGSLASSELKGFINEMMDGRTTVGKQVGSTYSDMFIDLFLDSSSVSIVKNPEGKGTDINLSAKE